MRSEERRRQGPWWRGPVAAFLVVLVAAGGVGCGDAGGRDATGGDAGDADDTQAAGFAGFAATAEYVTRIVDDSTDDVYRYSMTTESTASNAPPAPVVSGRVDEGRTLLHVDDRAVLAGPPPAGTTADDMYVEVVTVDDRAYVRAPLVRVTADRMLVDESVPAVARDLYRAMGEGWVSLDLRRLGGTLPADIAGYAVGDARPAPGTFLDLLEDSTSVRELAPRTAADGVPLRGLAAQVDRARALRVHAAGNAQLSLLAGELPEDGETVPMEVWVDRDGLVRQVRLDVDVTPFADLLSSAGSPAEEVELVDGVVVTTVVDFAGHGDESAEVEAPAGAVDMTDAFLAVEELAGTVPETAGLG